MKSLTNVEVRTVIGFLNEGRQVQKINKWNVEQLYLDYKNGFFNLESFRDYHSLSLLKAKQLIRVGAKLHAGRKAYYKLYGLV